MHTSPIEDPFLGTVTVGERGQIVIPADARKKFSIQTGDKLLILSHPGGQGLLIVKIDAVREMLNRLATSLSEFESQKSTGEAGTPKSPAKAG
jgi:AbrB family looped-hinge helix DNA binding protein